MCMWAIKYCATRLDIMLYNDFGIKSYNGEFILDVKIMIFTGTFTVLKTCFNMEWLFGTEEKNVLHNFKRTYNYYRSI